MAQPDDATVVYAEDPDELDLTFGERYGRPAAVGDTLIVGRTQWRRLATDLGWVQDPIAGIDFTKGRRR
jgi:hypothetical protein